MDVQQKTREGYEASVKRLVSFHGGSTAAMAAAADDARSRRTEGVEAVDVGMVNRESSYSQIPNMAIGGAWRGNWDGDIPAWAPKQYERKGVKPAFVAKGGRDTMVSYSRDNRLCVPARETLTNKGMQSIFTHSYTAMSGRADQPSYNMCRTDTVKISSPSPPSTIIISLLAFIRFLDFHSKTAFFWGMARLTALATFLALAFLHNLSAFSFAMP
jgi:hypothetical protein